MGPGPVLTHSEATIPLAKFQISKSKRQTNPNVKIQMTIEIQMFKCQNHTVLSLGFRALFGI